MTITVGTNGDFATLSKAVAEAERLTYEQIVIHLFPGRYHEKTVIKQAGITIEGESADSTVITYDDFANDIMPNGEKRGTFRSYTMLIDADRITLRNLTVENGAGFNEGAGQCIALYAEGDGITVENCCLISSQDTLFTGPLPISANIENGFRGPKEFAPRINGKQYYKDCYICGGVDFIFGSATAYFENCLIESVDRRSGYVTAGSLPEGYKYGYVFNNCRFEGKGPDKSVYLGRPWRDFARVVIMNSYLGPHIRPEGWHNWGREYCESTVFYAEYNNYGPGASGKRVGWAHQLTDDQAEEYTKEKVLGNIFNIV